MKNRDEPTRVSYVVIRNEHRVLLQCRQDTGYFDNHWSNAAAGYIEVGESAVQAAVREAREELGIELNATQLEPLTTMHRPQYSNGTSAGRVDFFFECTIWNGVPRIMEP
ncbi:NUDIX domain-containing protein [Glutamicibacter arilaitensis]|uniref:NUDIX domain-containing protein n=1 Tax=Glutamicibacter arilaitensis TaxID=256701 RepID=UPI0038516590